MKRYGPRRRVVDEVVRRIEAGVWSAGDRLPGEHQLAEEFAVSRGTIRNALTELNRRRVITTEGGIGSFVTYDGVGLGGRGGWAHALHQANLPVCTEVLRLEPHDPVDLDPVAPRRSGPTLLIERRRRLDDRVVSLERSYLPAVGRVLAALDDGLPDDSITALLREAGLVADHGHQRIGTHPLAAADAAPLKREPGTPMLTSTKITVDRAGDLVERVESILDPEHFEFSLDFSA